MQHKQTETIDLKNLCQGGAEEVFQRELAKVLENIADVNTAADAKRSINLNIEFAPGTDRRSAIVQFTAKTKLAGMGAQHHKVFFAQETPEGEIKAYSENPDQVRMFPMVSDKGQ